MIRPGPLAVALGACALAAGVAEGAPGDRDTSFGSGGVSVIGLRDDTVGTSIALDGEGRILVAGSTADADALADADAVVVRLTAPQGGLDPAYGAGSGWSRLERGGADVARSVTVQADGRILVGGVSTSVVGGLEFPWAARLSAPGGAVERDFGFGAVRTRFGADGSAMELVAQDAAGRVVVAGTGTFSAGESDFVTGRFGGADAFDTGFAGGTGVARTSFTASAAGGSADVAHAGLLQPDGRIVLAGASSRDMAVARLLADGEPDPGFGAAGTGRVQGPELPPGEARAVALAPDGGLVLAGVTGRGGAAPIVLRLRADGSPDAAFGSGGAFSPPGASERLDGVAVQADGRIVAVGATAGDMLVIRLTPDGRLDTGFGLGGRVTVDIGAQDRAHAVAIRPDGRLVVAGTTGAAGARRIAVVQLQASAPPAPVPISAPAPPPAPEGGGGASAPAPRGAAAATPAPVCGGRPATIVGTAGNDRLTGTPGADVIAGLAGDDTVRGLGGNDVVCGGAGSDALDGGAGADRLRGEAGRDVLRGGAGRDALIGGAGPDRLLGGPAVDVLDGGPGKDAQTQ